MADAKPGSRRVSPERDGFHGVPAAALQAPTGHNGPVDPRLANLLREIDPAVLGRRIRAARLGRGLTQSQVAGDRASVGYVSRIEAGQRRPDGALLEFMATQLSVSVEELLTGTSRDDLDGLRLALDYAELALATGSASDALAGAEDVVAHAPETGGEELERQARFVRARALEARVLIIWGGFRAESAGATSPLAVTKAEGGHRFP